MGGSTALLEMKLVDTPMDSKCHRAVCKLCGKKIYTPERVLLKYDNGGLIGYTHDDCLRKAYDIMLLNKL